MKHIVGILCTFVSAILDLLSEVKTLKKNDQRRQEIED